MAGRRNRKPEAESTRHTKQTKRPNNLKEGVIAMAIDPVCKMEVDEKTAEWTFEYQGETYYFCAPGCKKAFEENPEEYLEE